ncbi:caspase-7-like [Diorhabda carinulata]|uniref:caspase-7-like n=1 Tax=Diorhabda carinulata TaxID=1163345 RepID=UPI0025A2E564|nr:caspase-7-like [Diorhabda carinulata]
MNQECKDVIIDNFVQLMKNCDVQVLTKPLIKKGVFRELEINQIFSTDDTKHNKRIFFFALQKKENGWIPFLEALRETGQNSIANMLLRKGPTVFNEIMNSPDIEDEPLPDLSKLNLPINDTTDTLKVKVTLSSSFLDTYEHNGTVGFYTSRSQKRGRCLIINNYEFNNKDLPYRNGALVDQENLKKLFNQMGGWDLISHTNKTTSQMNMIIKNFANYKNNYLYDICFIIIMSHGGERCNDTVIYGIDANIQDNYISESNMRKWFSNENCLYWRGKPKILLFSVCRGAERHIPIKHKQITEIDGALNHSQVTSIPPLINLRSDEDMLIGFSTLLGYQSHRDYNRGTWYIELLCKNIMNYAHNHSINDIMLMVDEGFRLRISEKCTMQTSEIVNIGFKRLYLHPGLYFENGILKKYSEDVNLSNGTK